MIGKLRLKITLAILAILLAVFIIVLATINIYMNAVGTRQTGMFLDMILRSERFEDTSDGSFEGAPSDEDGAPPMRMFLSGADGISQAMRPSGFFIARVDADGSILSLNTDHIYGYAQSEALARVQEALATGQARGSIRDLQYAVEETAYGSLLIFAEKSANNHMLSELMTLSIYVISVSGVVLLALSFFISKWVVRPVKLAFDKQRAFISDASHELKTPLTILSANADMLTAEVGQNKWLGGIIAQAGRMKAIVSDLLSLARYDEQDETDAMSRFDLSELTLNTILEFESIVYEDGKTLAYDVGQDIQYVGDAASVKQLIAILMDNAVKHSAPGATLRVTLAAVGNRVQLSVFNTGTSIDQAEYEKIFERFYRSDASRSRETGGVGLGLAIAKSIVDMHKGKITVASVQGEGTCFFVTL